MDPQQLEKEFDIKIERVRLDLGYAQVFELRPNDGPPKWIPLNQDQNKKKLNSGVAKLESENNLLKLQVETLLDMVTHRISVLAIIISNNYNLLVDRNYNRSSSQ